MFYCVPSGSPQSCLFHHPYWAEVSLWSRRRCMICLLSVPLISFRITFPFVYSTSDTLVYLLFLTCWEHFHLWPLCLLFLLSFFFRCPFRYLHVSHPLFNQFSPQLSPQLRLSWPCPLYLKHILPLSIFLYWFYLMSSVRLPHQNAGSVRAGSLSCPLPYLRHLEQCLVHSTPQLGIGWFETMNEYFGCFDFFETKKVTVRMGQNGMWGIL